MPHIEQLPPDVINKIAAGEVVERPASVVKELLENSVDAGATRIELSVEHGGCELIRVADDGCGIAAGQLRLAVASHATSKIRSADDLFHVRTLGFRGEALASIAEISHLVLRSRLHDAVAGAEIEVEGGHLRRESPCGTPPGTCVEVRRLFFNTPVRRKFLRTPQTEMSHVVEAFTRVALAHPRLGWRLLHNDRPVHDLPPVERWRERIAALFGAELAESLIWIESREGDLELRGYVAEPATSRGNNRQQYLFLNGRHIRDRSLQHALSESYRGLLLTGRYPVAFLELSMPPDCVDVNVHPTKVEVRFQDGNRVYGQLLGAIRHKFLSTDLATRVRFDPAAADASGTGGPAPTTAPTTAQSLEPSYAGRPVEDRQAALPMGLDSPPPSGVARFRPFGPGASAAAPVPAAAYDHPQPVAAPGEAAATSGSRPGPTVSLGGRGVQLHNRYLVTEDDAGIVIIDQHALHERMLYEQLRERVLSSQFESQRLLVPEPVPLRPTEAAALLEAQETLGQLGIEVEAFGGDTVLVSSYPAMLANLGPAEVIRHILELLLASPKTPERRDLLDDLLHLIACKAAVKAGDRLTPDEVAALLDQRHLCRDSHHCPHGRPTALVFSREELDRRFLRT